MLLKTCYFDRQDTSRFVCSVIRFKQCNPAVQYATLGVQWCHWMTEWGHPVDIKMKCNITHNDLGGMHQFSMENTRRGFHYTTFQATRTNRVYNVVFCCAVSSRSQVGPEVFSQSCSSLTFRVKELTLQSEICFSVVLFNPARDFHIPLEQMCESGCRTETHLMSKQICCCLWEIFYQIAATNSNK